MKRILLSVACLAAGVSQAQVKWDLPTGYAANTFQTQNNQQFAKEVDELTGGKLKITLHPGGSLYKANEIKRAVQTGQVPAAEFILSGAANENALYGVDSVPFLASSYADAWRLYQVARPAQEKLLASLAGPVAVLEQAHPDACRPGGHQDARLQPDLHAHCAAAQGPAGDHPAVRAGAGAGHEHGEQLPHLQRQRRGEQAV